MKVLTITRACIFPLVLNRKISVYYPNIDLSRFLHTFCLHPADTAPYQHQSLFLMSAIPNTNIQLHMWKDIFLEQ